MFWHRLRLDSLLNHDAVSSRPRSSRAGRRPRLERLEDRVVPSYTWTNVGESSVAGNTVSMGVANRGEGETQPTSFHGAWAALPATRRYDVIFHRDLSTWDSYNAGPGGGTGYWDSFSVSVTSVPYPQLNVLQDPLQFPFVYGGNSWTDGVLEHSTGYSSFSAAFNVAGPKYLNVVLDTQTNPTADEAYPSWGTIKVITGDLAILKSDGTELSDELEQTQGGYVPLNNDNDNYNFAGNTEIIDKDEAGTVVGENDLIPMKLKAVDPAAEGGMYRLSFSSTKIKIWKNANKTDAVTSDTTEFDATQETTVYVEGVERSASRAAEEVQLKWVKGGFSGVLSRVRFTVYEVTGVTNVPGHTIYEYRATVPGGGTGSWAATGGTVQTGANTNTSTILWGAGPAVGLAKFTPIAGFTVDREVNVVQVQLAAAGANNSLTYTNPPNQTAADQRSIRSSPAGMAAMDARLRVTRIEGPTVAGAMRGVRFIEIGMIQDGRGTALHGDYDGFMVPRRRVWSIEDGAFHLDALGASTLPWYDSTGVTVIQAGAVGLFAPGTDPAAAITNTDISVTDTPTLPGTDMMSLMIGLETDMVDRFAIVVDFRIYLAVRTTQAVNNSQNVYTQRGRATWQFDGSGTINGAGTWAQTGTGNTGSASFAEITAGTIAPITVGPTLNTIAATTATWSTVNQ
jgi:hypothetical protein